MNVLRLSAVVLAAASCGDNPFGPVELKYEGSRTVELREHATLNVILGTVGPGHYADPTIMGHSVTFVSEESYGNPYPGGPQQQFTLRSVAKGTSIVRFAHTYNGTVVEDTVIVR